MSSFSTQDWWDLLESLPGEMSRSFEVGQENVILTYSTLGTPDPEPGHSKQGLTNAPSTALAGVVGKVRVILEFKGRRRRISAEFSASEVVSLLGTTGRIQTILPTSGYQYETVNSTPSLPLILLLKNHGKLKVKPKNLDRIVNQDTANCFL